VPHTTISGASAKVSHSPTYLLYQKYNLFNDKKKQNEIYNAIETMSTIGAKAKWAEMWCNPEHIAHNLLDVSTLPWQLLKAFFLVPSVPSFGLSNVVCSLAYDL
jgi:hypothetical protein